MSGTGWRDPVLRTAWAEVVSAGAIGSCHPQRVEFRRSARTTDEYEQMSGMFERCTRMWRSLKERGGG